MERQNMEGDSATRADHQSTQAEQSDLLLPDISSVSPPRGWLPCTVLSNTTPGQKAGVAQTTLCGEKPSAPFLFFFLYENAIHF